MRSKNIYSAICYLRPEYPTQINFNFFKTAYLNKEYLKNCLEDIYKLEKSSYVLALINKLKVFQAIANNQWLILKDFISYNPIVLHRTFDEDDRWIDYLQRAFEKRHEVIKYFPPKEKKECPRLYLDSKEFLVKNKIGNLIIFEKTFAQLQRRSRKNIVVLKSTLNLNDIHHDLRCIGEKIITEERGNVAIAVISFELKVNEKDKSIFFVNFPIKIPSKKVYGFSDINEFSGSDTESLHILKGLYN